MLAKAETEVEVEEEEEAEGGGRVGGFGDSQFGDQARAQMRMTEE